MNLLCDKYRPKELSKLDFHKKQAEDLKNLTKQGDFPHLLIYGPNGCGKKTRIMCLLRELYGPGIERLRLEKMQFQTPSNKKLEITTASSNFHIELNPSDVGINDRVVIMEIIKNVAQTQQLDVNGQKEFKVIVLNNVECLSREAQNALRRTMEKYISTCRIILCSKSISLISDAIKSRCFCIRVPAPSNDDISKIILNICRKESITITPEFAQKISESSGRNLRRALLTLEACKVQNYPFLPNQTIPEPDWLTFIKTLAKRILNEQSVAKIMGVRNDLYQLLSHGIPRSIIFNTLLEELLGTCDMELKIQVVELAAKYDNRMAEGKKDIFHLEAFIINFMSMYKKYMEECIGNDF